MKLHQGIYLKYESYRIECVLGQGGFGITYLATQVGLDRQVAIKEFFMKEYCNRDATTSHVSIGSDGSKELVSKFKTKFIKEAKTIAGLNHPNIIRIYDIFEENGTAYYVMEYHGNGSLSELLKSKVKLSERESLRYIRQIADALSYIHKRNMNHLDVKPGNVLLDEEGNAVLIDFGLSKRYDEEGNQTSTTPVGISHGYAPMEQYKKGGVGVFSPSTDIYSLGATLYKLLTGETPPEADEIYEEGLPALPATISVSVRSAIVAAMQPKRKDRPQSISEFLQLLDGDNVGEQDGVTLFNSTNQSQLRSTTEQTIITDHYANIHNGHDYVDLGLSVKWATCNVGAGRPEEYGSYFAWGETNTKDNYDWRTLQYCKNGLLSVKFSKYCTNSGYGIIDNKSILEIIDDAARVNWGGSWRMPTSAELYELKTNCTWTWTTLNGVKGCKVTGPNGNSIFLPAAGYRNGMGVSNAGSLGYYWSGSLYSGNPSRAYSLDFDLGDVDLGDGYRCYGRTVRAVCP